MGVYIPGMEIPKNGETITITICDDGIVFEKWKEPGSVFKAVPVPPHVDLIDRDALLKGCERTGNEYVTREWAFSQSAIEYAPTIIASEEGE